MNFYEKFTTRRLIYLFLFKEETKSKEQNLV